MDMEVSSKMNDTKTCLKLFRNSVITCVADRDIPRVRIILSAFPADVGLI